MPQLLEWLEATSIGLLVRESVWGFPIVVAIHIMGLMLSVGLLVWFDLRLLGASMRGHRASAMYRCNQWAARSPTGTTRSLRPLPLRTSATPRRRSRSPNSIAAASMRRSPVE